MSGAERVEPEVSPTLAKPRNNNRHTRGDTHTYADTYTHCVLVNCSIHLLKNTGI